MDHDYYGAIILFLIVLIMMLPSTLDKIRKAKTKENQK